MARTGIYEKLLRSPRTRQEANDQAQSDQTDTFAASLGVLLGGTALKEEQTKDNQWNLAEGDYGAVTNTKPHGAIHAVTGGARFTRMSRFEAHSTITGVEFTDTNDPDSPFLVRVSLNSTALFRNCLFTRTRSGVSHVEVVFGSKAVFVGCIFKGPGASIVPPLPNVIENPSIAANVQLLGGVNYTGNPLGNVVGVGMITP